MISKNKDKKNSSMQIFVFDDVVPQNHILRKIDKYVDFSFIYDLVKDSYCLDNGRPSIDPVILIKVLLIQKLFGIYSIRRTIEEIKVNIAYMWFLGYNVGEKVLDHSTISCNYRRRFMNSNLFEQIFTHILLEAYDNGFVNSDAIYVDATHVKANANKNKYVNKSIEVAVKSYQQELEKEINEEREDISKPPFPPSEVEHKDIKESKTDPESGLLHKKDNTKTFSFAAHTACDKNGFVLGTIVTASNIHDSVMYEPLIKSLNPELLKNNRYLVADAGYKTPYICKHIIEDLKKIPILPYVRPKGRRETDFYPIDFVYDEYYDEMLCPENKLLSYRNIDKKGYKIYKSNICDCSNCPSKSKCIPKGKQKTVTRHIWKHYVEETDYIRSTYEGIELYKSRKEKIERIFADGKELHGLRYTKKKGLKRVGDDILLIFAAMNMKKMANWLSKSSLSIAKFLKNLLISLKFSKI